MSGFELAGIEKGAAWLWGKFGASIIKTSSVKLASKWREFHWDEAEKNYRTRLHSSISTTRILGKQKPIHINNFYTDVYVHDRLSAFQYFDLSEIGTSSDSLKKLENEKKRTKAENLLKDDVNLYILGKPGAGKTTFLKHLALEACNGRIGKTPIFISLREWSESNDDLLGFISGLFDVCGFPAAKDFISHILEKGNALVLFDGLDEVNQEDEVRNKTILAIQKFAQKYHACSICLTCRIAANEYDFDNFDYVEIADFNKEQQCEFIDRWFQDDTSNKDAFLTEWNANINAGIRELGATPLLLTLICLAYGETLSFPSRRVDLYQEALDALLKKWDSSRGVLRFKRYHALSIDRKRQLLSRVAIDNFNDGNYLFARSKIIADIKKCLDKLPGDDTGASTGADMVLDAIEAQHGLLVERAKDIYSFSHLTLQEYFSARYVSENQGHQELPKLVKNTMKDNRWREVFLMVASLLDDATDLFTLCSENLEGICREHNNINLLVSYLNEKNTSIQTRLLSTTSTPISLKHSGLEKSKAVERVKDSAYSLAAQLSVGHFGRPSHALTRSRTLVTTLSNSGAGGAPTGRLIDLILSNKTECSALANYISFSALVIEGLRLAAVPERSLIENSILRPANLID